jgi:hypothetical protein
VEIHECECEICQVGEDEAVKTYHRHINLVLSRLDEAQQRWYAASLSSEPGAPSDDMLAQITGLSSKTIQRGRHDLEAELSEVEVGHQRRSGGGRKKAEKKTRNASRH